MSEPSHLQHLNPEQHQAVITTKGALLILAGAGSGKTRVLTRRIAHMLHTGVEPLNILAVTFTNKAAAEMKGRVAELVGEAASKVWISTFHSTCARILRMDIEALGYTRRFSIFDDDDQRRIMKQIALDCNVDVKHTPVKDLLSRIDHYKNRMMNYDDVVAQRRAHRNDPLIRVWEAYEEALSASDAVDFNDLIGLTVKLFREHPDIRDKWSDRFHYVMVDEYQDTNKGQYQLLQLLAEKHGNLGVVGDDDQSIYGFRGADVENILGFQRDYPDALVIRLEQNYRSSRHILDVANHVVSLNRQRLDKQLWTDAPEGPAVRLMEMSTPKAEAEWVSAACQKLLTMGFSLDDIAIIYRTNAMSRPIEAAFRAKGLDYRVLGGKKFYERREIRDVLAYLRLVINPADDSAFLRVINVPSRKIGPATIKKLRDKAQEDGAPLFETASRHAGLFKNVTSALHDFVELIDNFTLYAREQGPHNIVHEVTQQSGYQTMLELEVERNKETARETMGRLENLQVLNNEACAIAYSEDAEGVTPFDRLTIWMDQIALSGRSDEVAELGEATLLTVHSSKGLEFPVVFVVQMNEGAFPHKRSLDDGISEERRLAYVAFTRAMKRLIICRTTVGPPHGRDFSAALPSRFLYGLPEHATVGDLPTGSVQDTRAVNTLESPGTDALRKMLQWKNMAPAVSPAGEYTLTDVESPEQLTYGVRVFHDKFGVGTVTTCSTQHVRIQFEQAGSRRLALQGLSLQLICD